MLFLQFQLGNDRYAIDTKQVVEVLPLLGIKQIPHAPAGVAGVFNYRGKPVPAVDLSEMALGRPARRQMSTRIIVVRHPDGAGTLHMLGLIAERATEAVHREAADFAEAGVRSDGTPYLGPVAADPEGLVQWIDVTQLLQDPVREVLFLPPSQPQ